LFGTCSGLPGNCVSIVATATATNFSTANPEQALIRLVPTGVILPPASNPTAAFTISPTPVNFNVASTFDASTSTPGNGASAITSYNWTFGDGSSGTGKVVSHTYTQSTSPGNAYNVTLSVTNDRGLTASTTQAVSVDASPAPSGDWVFSPNLPSVGDTVFFNADAVKPAAGHKLVQFSWNFGDGGSASGFQATHAFANAASYTVVLSAADDAGQKTVIPHTVIVSSGSPVAVLKLFKTGGNVIQADGSASTAAGTAAIATYRFIWGDGSPDTVGASSSATHDYGPSPGGAGSHTVTLVVTDNAVPARTSSAQASITTP
jgi:chitodextrinase